MSYLLLAEGNTLGETLKHAMLPEKINLLGMSVGPSFFSAIFTTAIILLLCLLIRIFVIPKFKNVPGKMQMCLEGIVNFFDNIVNDSTHKYKGFLAPYIFTAACYICLGTLIEMLGIRPVMSDINACIGMALFTYLQLVVYSFINRGPIKGLMHSVQEFTIAISFSFRLFGSILSGLLIMELVYSYLWLSFVVPAFLSVIFTLFHAFIQSYVFAMLSALFLGDAIGEKNEILPKKKKLEKGLSV